MSHYTVKGTVIGHLEKGSDLYNGITRIAEEQNITAGRVTGMGAVQKAKLAFYDQTQMTYRDIEIPEPMEILSLYGNISLKDEKPFVHAHVVLSDKEGNGRGGHLLPGGTPVFACELIIEQYDGPPLVRSLEEETRLTLWPKDKLL